jgi:hypothetical protein
MAFRPHAPLVGGAVRTPFLPVLKTAELRAQYIDDQAATESPGEFRILFGRENKQLLDLALGLLLQGKHPSSSVLRGCRRAPSSICASPKDLTGAVHEGTGAAPLQLRRPLKGTGALAHWRNGTWTAPIAPVVRQLKNADWRSVYSSFQSPGMT